MLLAQSLSFSRGKRTIFSEVDLTLSEKKIILLSGKNGSGKTTLLKIILNILDANSGSIYWKGKNIKFNLYDFYLNMTYIADKTSSIKHLSIEDNLKIWKKIFQSKINDDQINKILKILKIDYDIRSKTSLLSLGELKKLELIRLIIEDKKIWILDEPFTNLDSESVNLLNQTFEDHYKNNGSILFTSHQDPDVIISEKILI